MTTYDDAVAMTASWPGVTADKWYGTPGLKVGGKGFARMWSEREYRRDEVDDTDVLVVIGDPDEKPALIAASGGVLFSTPHYDGHGGMLIRLADVDPDDLIGYLEDAYRLKAAPKLLAEFDAS
jgi:hypothetical protein